MGNKTDNRKIIKSKKAVIDAHTHVGVSARFYYQQGYPYALSFEDLVFRMDSLGIDHSVVFPFVDSRFYVADDASPEIKTTNRYCRFPYEQENQNLLHEIYEIFPQHSHRALPFLMFDPSRETAQQAGHMEALLEKYPVYGLKTATTYIQAYVADMETKGKPIADLARKKGLPITFHSSVHPQDPWASAYDIVDFAERNPDIRVCIAHSARFAEPVLKKAGGLPNCFVDLSAFIIHCKLAVADSPGIAPKEKRFEANYHDPLSVMIKLTETYPDTIIWGSDTPFYYWIQKYHTADGKLADDRLECGYDEEPALLHRLPDDIKSRISHRNIIHFLFGKKS